MKRIIPFLILLVATPAHAECARFLRKYNEDTTININVWLPDGSAYYTGADFVAGDILFSQSEAAQTNCTEGTGACVTDEGSFQSIAIDAAELDTKRLNITMSDVSGDVWLDKCVVVETFGDANAQFPTATVDVVSISGDSVAADNVEAAFDGTATTELSGCPTGTADLVTMIKYLYQLGRNKFTATSGTGTLFKDDGSTSLCTFTTSDNGTTFTNGEGS